MTGKRAPKYLPAETPGGERITSVTEAMIAAHIAGTATHGGTLDDGHRARLGALEEDHRGRAGLLLLLDAARAAELVAFALAYDTPGGHCGGHVFFVYADWHHPAQIAAQLQAVAAAAGQIKPEVWPGAANAIRYPFGYHKLARTFGELILQSGETFTLDHPAARAAGCDAVMSLAMNSAPPALPEPAPAPAPAERPALRVSPGEAGAARLSLADARARFNAEHTIESLLDHYGATRTKDGYTCCCGVQHTHATTLYISRHGKLFSYSPRCDLHTRYGYDAFGLYVKMEHHDDVTAALRTINPPPEPRQRRQEPPHSAEVTEYTLTPEEQTRRAADAARKRDERGAAARAYFAEAVITRAEIEARASADEALSDTAQLVLLALLDAAGPRDWCRWSVARIAETLTICERRVHHGLRELEDRRYIESGHKSSGTTVRTLLRLHSSPVPDDHPSAYAEALILQNADENIHVIHEREERACERRAAAPAPTAAADEPGDPFAEIVQALTADDLPTATAALARLDPAHPSFGFFARTVEARAPLTSSLPATPEPTPASLDIRAERQRLYVLLGITDTDGARLALNQLWAMEQHAAAPMPFVDEEPADLALCASYDPAADCSCLDPAERRGDVLLPHERPERIREARDVTPMGARIELPDAAPPEQHSLDAAPPAVRGPAPARVSFTKSYTQELATMDGAAFAAELRKITNFELSGKYTGALWLRAKRAALDDERRRRGWKTADTLQDGRKRSNPSGAPPKRAARCTAVNLSLFGDVLPRSTAAAIAGVAR